jgi:hypothetical protein
MFITRILKEYLAYKRELSMPSDSDLLELSKEHLYHEIWMLFGTPTALGQLLLNDIAKNALIESFAIHTRNLIDFFYLNYPKPDDLTASQFIDDDQHTFWEDNLPSITPFLTAVKTRANKEISHLTKRRVAGIPPQKEWLINPILDEMADLLRFFVINASPLRLHSSVKTLVLARAGGDSQPPPSPDTPPLSPTPYTKSETHRQWFTGTLPTTPNPASIRPKR